MMDGIRLGAGRRGGSAASTVVTVRAGAAYKADTDLIEKPKKGRSLAIQAFEKGGPTSFTLPLAGFAKAYDGPATDPTGLNQLQEGLPNRPQSPSEDHTPDGK